MINELIERLEKATGPDRCWAWPRKTDAKGRGRVWVNGKIMLAHRAVWEHVNAPIPKGKMLCHHCDNAGCINPKHMYVGTHAENMRDMKDRKRYFAAKEPECVKELGRALGLSNTWARGSKNPKARLSRADAATISKSSEATKILAERFGVDRTTIQRIRRGALWT